MLGQFKPVTFDPYGKRRKGRHLPSWLVLLLCGSAAGAIGFAVVQERYLPPRLSVDASARLRTAFEQADAERQRLSAELGATTQRLEAALAEKKALDDELAGSRASIQSARDDVAAILAALPPDPRGGSVEVRAAWITARGASLAYSVVLSRDHAAGKTIAGVMRLIVTGESARGTETTIDLKPVTLSISDHEVVRGSQPLPEGFKPRQTSIQVLDRVAGKLLGMRVMLVK
jgi:hypothetical protein